MGIRLSIVGQEVNLSRIITLITISSVQNRRIHRTTIMATMATHTRQMLKGIHQILRGPPIMLAHQTSRDHIQQIRQVVTQRMFQLVGITIPHMLTSTPIQLSIMQMLSGTTSWVKLSERALLVKSNLVLMSSRERR